MSFTFKLSCSALIQDSAEAGDMRNYRLYSVQRHHFVSAYS